MVQTKIQPPSRKLLFAPPPPVVLNEQIFTCYKTPLLREHVNSRFLGGHTHSKSQLATSGVPPPEHMH